MKIRVHIDRLVLDGLPVTSAQGAHVRAAVERELARRLATGGLASEWRAGGAVPRVQAPHFAFAAHDRPNAIARHIARSVHARIGRGE